MDLGDNIWKKGRKTNILGKFRRVVPVQVRAVSVQVVFCFSVSTSVGIFAILSHFGSDLSDSSF